MLTKSTFLAREDLSVAELTRLIRSNILDRPLDETASAHLLNADTSECMGAIRCLNEKLSQYVEDLSVTALREDKRNESLERSMLRSSVEIQKINQDKLSTALANQMSFYEQELGRLEAYKAKIGNGEYDFSLSNEIAAAKAQNSQISKEIGELKLKVKGMVAQTDKQNLDSQNKRQDLLQRVKYYEEKIAKLEGAPEGKETFLRKLQAEDKKTTEKIEEIRTEFGSCVEDAQYLERKKAAELRAKIERVRSLNEQVSETLKRQAAVVQADIDRLNRECANLKLDLGSKTERAEQQAREIRAEEEKMGKTISDVKKFIFQERQSRQEEDRKRQTQEKEKARIAKFTVLKANKKLNTSGAQDQVSHQASAVKATGGVGLGESHANA